jgi:hypothetical protein
MTCPQPSSLAGLASLTGLTALALLHLPADLGAALPEPRPLGLLAGPSSLQQLKVQSHYDDNSPGSFVLTGAAARGRGRGRGHGQGQGQGQGQATLHAAQEAHALRQRHRADSQAP